MTDALRGFLLGIVQLLFYILIARILISWLFLAGLRNDFVTRLDGVLSTFTEPLMRPLRRVIPPFGVLDITPIVAMLILYLLRRVILTVL